MDVASTITGLLIAKFWWLLPLLLVWFIVESAWFKGKIGEWAVKHSFKRHLNPEHYTVLHDLTLPFNGGTTQIDHVILSPYGLFVIETKNYSGWIYGSVDESIWTQTFHRKKFRFQNPLKQNAKHVRAVTEALGIEPGGVCSVVIFTGSAKFKTAMPENVTSRSGGVLYIRRWNTVIFTREQTSKMVETLTDQRLPPGFTTNRSHVRHLKEAAKSPRCPQCQTPLAIRTAKKGPKAGSSFWGCPNFPKCRFTRPIKQP